MPEKKAPRGPSRLDPARANHERIKFQLRLRGYTLADVSRQLSISRATLTLVGLGHQRSSRVEQALAELLDKDLVEVFPDRYIAAPTDDTNDRPH